MNDKIMSISCLIKSVVLLLLVSNSLIAQHQTNKLTVRPWKGFSVLGNGSLCAVYSDDSRTKGRGLQNLYYGMYTCSYIGSSYSNIYRKGTSVPLKSSKIDSLGMSNFFTTSTKSFYDNSVVKEINCFAHPGNGIVLSMKVSGKFSTIFQKTEFLLKKRMITDHQTNLQTVRLENGRLIAAWSNDTYMIIGCKNTSEIISVKDSVVTVSGPIKPDEITYIVITIAKTVESGQETMSRLLSEKDLAASAKDYWNAWINKGVVPTFQKESEKKYAVYYERNLYSIKSALLGGFVPSDITGYFETNHMPQLYPRDAMMCARVFMLTGHLEEAKDIINFWTNRKISMKSKGEWYARYDAYTSAIDGGAGARYDEPEWDANGYFIQLVDMYHQKTNTWLADTGFIYELSDFLLSKIDNNGLLYEGGIVEWSGYLPATNMTAAAALKTAAKIALSFGNQLKAKEYEDASNKIASSLSKMFDVKNNTYADVRYMGQKGKNNESIRDNRGDTLYLWNTTMNFGVLWGFPNHAEVISSNAYYQKTTVKNGGGVQYFDAPDQGLAGYGNCMFMFSTAARSQYQSLYGDSKIAKSHIDWMIRNANTYGLMPERITLDDSDPTPASPLFWCNAEFSAAVLYYKLSQ